MALSSPYPLGDTIITWTATDSGGSSASCQQMVRVANPNPTVTITAPSSGAIYAVGTSVNFTGTLTDNPGTHTSTWMFDNISQAGSVNETTGALSTTHTFTSAGVYLVTLTVSDGCGGTGTTNTVDGLTAMVVVYDPNGGFVTGGGWFDSPFGAYIADPMQTGKASFGFVSRYLPGAIVPSGNTEFQFRAAGFNFKSTSYDWLVVAGARAQYKGTGTVNGSGNYGFMLTAIDGQVNGGGGMDKLRIKIWDRNNNNAIVYDNQMNTPDSSDPSTALGGGNVVIHR
jgi:PKD repeat protein